jgi:hypothetical protein
MKLDRQVQGDTRADAVCTFFSDQHPDLITELQEFIVADQHRLSKNYMDLDWLQFPFITTWKLQGKITGYSTGWARDFYPSLSIRLLNRFYIAPANRTQISTKLLQPATHATIDQQIGFSDSMGFKYKFISREVRAPRQFEMFITELSDRSINAWEYRRGPYLCAPDPDNSECWQSIGLSTEHDTTPFWHGLKNGSKN